jgi:hypothetical protein
MLLINEEGMTVIDSIGNISTGERMVVPRRSVHDLFDPAAQIKS